MIALDQGALKIDGKRLQLLSGDVHYWRLETEAWPKVLDRVCELGLNIIQSYIPWSVHEMRPGHFDFGQYDPKKNLGAFIDLAREKGLYFLARPGPHINAEITYFGYPKRLFEDEELLSRSASGSPVAVTAPPRFFPALSYANDRLYEEFADYLDALCPILAERQHPDGPVIGIQPDNEMSGFFRTGAYDHDYSDAAARQYSRFLKDRYGSVENMNAVYRSEHEHFDQAPMPRRFDAENLWDLPRYMDWMQFKEVSMLRPLSRIGAMFRERGLTRLLTFHNLPMSRVVSPFNVGLAERELDMMGVDFYYRRKDALKLRDKVKRLAGTSRLAFSPEFGAGSYLWWPPIGQDDEKFTIPYAVMHGLKAFNFYMIVDRERWYGSPILRDGKINEPGFSFFRDFLKLMKDEDLPSLARSCEAAICQIRDYDRLEKAATLFSPLPPLLMETEFTPEMLCDERLLGMSRCVQIEYDVQSRAWRGLLERGRVPYDLTDTDADARMLNRYRLLVCPTFEFASRQAQESLIAYAKAGGVLVIGPDVPEMDETMHDASVLGQFTKKPVDILLDEPTCVTFDCGKGRIVLLSAPLPAKSTGDGHWSGPLLASLLDLSGVGQMPDTGDENLETILFAGKGKELLFAANATDADRTADLSGFEARRMVDRMTGEAFRGTNLSVVPMPPYTVRILEVQS